MMPQFTDAENYVIAYHRDVSVSSPSRAAGQDIALLIVSLTLVVATIASHDVLWSGIGFGMLFLRQVRHLMSTLKYGSIYRSIFSKYEECLSKVKEEQKKQATE